MARLLKWRRRRVYGEFGRDGRGTRSALLGRTGWQASRPAPLMKGLPEATGQRPQDVPDQPNGNPASKDPRNEDGKPAIVRAGLERRAEGRPRERACPEKSDDEEREARRIRKDGTAACIVFRHIAPE